MSLPDQFKEYLRKQKAQPATIKNYVADVKHFFTWVGSDLLTFFTKHNLTLYRSFLLSQKTPLSTLNRRLSSLRKFGTFALSLGLINENPASLIDNVTVVSDHEAISSTDKLLFRFAISLKKNGVSQITIKNYLSDLRHFFGWLENQF